MKNIKYILSFFVLALFLVGCEAEKPTQDPEDIASTAGYPTPTFSLSSGELTSNEQNEMVIVYNIVMDKPIDRPIDFSWVVLGGSATEHDDFDFVNGTVPAFGTTGQMMIVIHSDSDITEGTEDLQLTIQSGPSLANQYLVNPNTTYPTVNVSIEDWIFCSWILEASDTYGDGWNGGYVEVITEGVTTQYAAPASGPGDVTTFEISITDGAEYSIAYVSGGGTGGAPGWESENYFKLTAPDGTFWEEGSMDYSGVPTEGVISSGTNNCN